MPNSWKQFFSRIASRSLSQLCTKLCLVAISIFGICASASPSTETIAGLLTRSGNSYYLRTQNETTYLIVPATPELHKELGRLKHGDFIVGQGEYRRRTKQVFLEVINVVGLKSLIGFWQDAQKSVYEFRNFDELNLYQPANSELLVQSGQFKYTIAPEADNRWAIFISGENGFRLGLLEITDTQILLTLLSSETGHPEDVLTLSRIGLRPNGLRSRR